MIDISSNDIYAEIDRVLENTRGRREYYEKFFAGYKTEPMPGGTLYTEGAAILQSTLKFQKRIR